MKIVIGVIYVVILFSCSQGDKTEMKGQIIKADEYLFSATVNDQDNELFFRIVSNPYKWDERAHLIFYLNNEVVYSGVYQNSGVLQTAAINSGKLVHFRMEIVKDNMLYVFEDKSNFNWDDGYKYIYVGIFPGNPSTDNIHFFPQKAEVIQ